MTDAEKREKVIKALRACYPADVKWCQARVKGQCDYNVAYCRMALFKDAAELLEAQEPCVMKVGDVRSWVNSDRTAREPVIIEMRNGVCAWIVDDEVRELKGAEDLTSELYGKTWRCWTSRPTEEQREATPWS